VKNVASVLHIASEDDEVRSEDDDIPSKDDETRSEDDDIPSEDDETRSDDDDILAGLLIILGGRSRHSKKNKCTAIRMAALARIRTYSCVTPPENQAVPARALLGG
jgi:hypothetical protein